MPRDSGHGFQAITRKEIYLMTHNRVPRVAMTLAALFILLAGPPPALAQTLTLRTERGCGASAVFQAGELTRFFLSTSQTAQVVLTLRRPDGSSAVLVNAVLQGGLTYFTSGRAGAPFGERTLTMTAGGASTTCTYTVGSVTPPPPTQAQRVLGTLLSDGAQQSVTAPLTAQVGVPFQVTITTTGGGCEEKGDEGVIVADNGATIMVYDLTTATRPGVQCTTIFKQFTHTVTLSFPQPGEKLIQVWGRRTGPGLPLAGVPIVVERRVLVQ
jgi:hypothetical protein